MGNSARPVCKCLSGVEGTQISGKLNQWKRLEHVASSKAVMCSESWIVLGVRPVQCSFALAREVVADKTWGAVILAMRGDYH